MTTQPIEYVRPTWREVNIDLLAKKMFGAHGNHNDAYMDANWPMISLSSGRDWARAAKAAVDELIDRPEREFQAQIDKVLSGEPNEILTLQQPHVGSWSPAAAGDWL